MESARPAQTFDDMYHAAEEQLEESRPWSPRAWKKGAPPLARSPPCPLVSPVKRFPIQPAGCACPSVPGRCVSRQRRTFFLFVFRVVAGTDMGSEAGSPSISARTSSG